VHGLADAGYRFFHEESISLMEGLSFLLQLVFLTPSMRRSYDRALLVG
jgi:hypothetical protein